MSKLYDISVQSHETALKMRAVNWTMELAIGRNFMIYPRGSEPPKT